MIMYKRSLHTLLFIIIFVVIASSAFAESRYIRKQNENSGVIVFVHGVLGGATATWTNETTKAFWPHLIRDDATFAGFKYLPVRISQYSCQGKLFNRRTC